MKNRVIRIAAVAAALMLMALALAEVRTTGDVWLRRGPGLDYETVAILSAGKTFEYLGETRVDERNVTWYRISNGKKEGWVSGRYAELIGGDAEAGKAVTAAPTQAPEGRGILFDAGAPLDEPAKGGEAPEKSTVPARTVELSGYYLKNLVEAANEIGLISYRQVESEAPYQYFDDALILAGNQQVENIVVYGPGYEVYGVYVGMDESAARACLNAAGLDYMESMNGFTYEHRATAASLFTDPKGHDSCINVWVDGTGVVTEIDWSTYTG